MAMSPTVPINYLAVLVAAIANMVIGFLWYGPVFGKTWMKLMKFNKKKMDEEKKKGMAKNYIIMFISSLVMAFVLAHALVFGSAYLNIKGIPAGLMVGFWNWLGFIATVMLGMVLWDGKPWKLYFLNVGYYLVALLVMGSILAVWS